jgi:ribosomal protein S18 acetylase RimI-like enzyme
VEHARAATAEDLPAIVALARAAIAELAPQRGGALWQAVSARREPIEAGLEADLALEPGEGKLVVGTIDGTPVGYGFVRLTRLADGRTLATISDLFVDPEARGIGLGEAMMDLLVDAARAGGAFGVDSVALPGARETKNFFETFGLKARALIVHRSLRDDGQGDGPPT